MHMQVTGRRLGFGALGLAIALLATAAYGSVQGPKVQQAVTTAKVTSAPNMVLTAWSGGDGTVTLAMAQSKCSVYTAKLTNRTHADLPWQVLVDNKTDASGTMPPQGAAPVQHIPMKGGNGTVRVTVRYGNPAHASVPLDQLFAGTASCR